MTLINRNITRTIKNSTDSTFETQSASSDTLAFNLSTSDAFYMGYKEPFSTRYFHFGTVNATSSIPTIQYWNGTAYAAVEDVVDQTNSLTQSGFISWENKNDWKTTTQTPVTDVELYWIKMTVGTNLDAGTTLQSCLNLFCDENLVRAYYPEIISDTRYLPTGRSDFTEQLVAAKNLVVLRLKQDHIIKDESEIIDVNEVAISAVHAFAWIVLNPIAMDEIEKERRDEAFENFNRELNRVKLDFDFDNTGIIESDEKNIGQLYIPR